MIPVILAHRTNSVVAQKFLWIEHASEQTFHTMAAGKGDKPGLVHARLLPARDQTGEVRPIRQMPFKPRLESRQLVDQLPLNRLYREKWHQTDDRSNL